ncbi:MAG: AAA family ATPase [Mycobacteriales bacterium]
MTAPAPGPLWLLTGIQTAGKSTVADLLARRYPRGVHVRGDLFRRMVVTGRADMTPEPSADALAQLGLRYTLGARTADAYATAGFAVAYQDVILGPLLETVVQMLASRPRRVVVLAPRPEVVAAREAARTKTAYGDGGFSVARLDTLLRHATPHLGLWLDNSDLTPEQTVDHLLAREAEATID